MSSDSTIEATSLPHFVFWALQAAEGWLMLGNSAEALAELEDISPEDRLIPAVLAMEWRVNEACGKKQDAWFAAKRLCQSLPHCAAAWICQANALRAIRGTEAAADLLLSVVGRFATQPVIHYNLACYNAQLGDLGVAGQWLLKAFELDGAGDLKTLSLLDPDLTPLWHGIADTFAASLGEEP
jgi:predicted Zn-dependent protease